MTEREMILAHHGVKGQRWGVRKDYKSLRTRRLQRAVDKQEKELKSWKDSTSLKAKLGRAIYTKKHEKELTALATRRLGNLRTDLVKSQMRDEIRTGKSYIKRVYDRMTGIEKLQADIRYDQQKKRRVTKAWND